MMAKYKTQPSIINTLNFLGIQDLPLKLFNLLYPQKKNKLRL